ncbi:hypothetical protein IWX90DRAFT_486579 [Phyllosticta citrichinensis]|uniref:Uncharacterized protein n=1 Tax=Phyllosticta citrichinensis TaxID=1130410 RepID=A0ABR1XUD2_9PEZI
MSSPSGKSRSSSSSSICSEMMHSIILDPDKKPDFLVDQDYDFVELSDGDTLLGSSSSSSDDGDDDDDDDDDGQPVKDGDKKRRKDATTSENGVQADKPVKSSSNSKQLPPSSSLTREWNAATDAENTASKWAGVFHSTGSPTEESDDFDHIDATEAQDARVDERTARIEKAKAIQRRRNELRRIAPAPEQIRCPCLTGGKDGWKGCIVPAHVELGRLTIKGIR